MTQQQLMDLKDQISEAKNEVERLKGREEHLMQELKEKFGCDTVEQAKQRLEKMDQKINDLTESIEQKIEELKENYEINI